MASQAVEALAISPQTGLQSHRYKPLGFGVHIFQRTRFIIVLMGIIGRINRGERIRRDPLRIVDRFFVLVPMALGPIIPLQEDRDLFAVEESESGHHQPSGGSGGAVG